MPEIQSNNIAPHFLSLSDRSHLIITGVNDIVFFDEKCIILCTSMGKLTIKGHELKINKLQVSTDGGDVNVDGDIYSIDYGVSKAPATKDEKFFSKLFK